MSHDETLGYCGLYCAGCGGFQATAAGQPIRGEDGQALECRGCNSDVVAPWCRDCGLKACARQRGFRYCLECPDYVCEQLQGFIDDPRYPYHKDTPAAMLRLREVGLEAWSVEQDAKWNCAACGGRFHWFATECPGCGAAVNVS